MTGRLAEEGRLVLLAVQFLTRLPLPFAPGYTPERMGHAMRYFPLVGLAIGGGLAAVYALSALVFPPVVAALLAVAAGVRLTGALHEDGLADMADGLGGGATRERALEIMRDSRIGSYGAVTLGLVLALKVAALAGLGAAAAGALVGAHGLSRLSTLALSAALPYARAEGKAVFASVGLGPMGWPIALAGGAAALLVLMATAGIVAAVTALIAAVLVTLWLGRMMRRRLGGQTGDGLGAAQQLGETAILLELLAWA
ncbi:adenosylcobinamide-GDP ribazoletransferase [Rhodovulum adriaticum]|uniref:Adenosylcobinamide-GDP ribazoletransferase n=1 Tax=Rhodovulum adriaticum TaxID=35804 RepID=A0A4R2NX16_RHOAD|nr:adenosylcobinamide-GDP ribazoletransferase [Rhodovulum adriaticum]MBK1635600.1 adenosylcobinamide-GDP ribazoletransferase [Rhodovulum adriaticum]TCP26164.1 cobalamin-5'-phosphate synthase [Rhodovulum adriaticum]